MGDTQTPTGIIPSLYPRMPPWPSFKEPMSFWAHSLSYLAGAKFISPRFLDIIRTCRTSIQGPWIRNQKLSTTTEGPRGPWEPLGAPRRLPRPLGPPAVVVDSFWFPTGRSFEVGPDVKLRVGGLFLGTAYHMALCARAWSVVSRNACVPCRAEIKGRDRAYRHASHRLIILVQAYTWPDF